jgi:hypothetical protein
MAGGYLFDALDDDGSFVLILSHFLVASRKW